jgi:hypothetical protein
MTIPKWSIYLTSTTVAALLIPAAAQQTGDSRLAGSWKTDFKGAQIRIWNSGSGWSAAYSQQGSDPIVVKGASGGHITLVEYVPRDSACFAGMQRQFELDLSSDGNNLVGKVQVARGSCGDWDDRGDHRMKWVSILGTRAQ